MCLLDGSALYEVGLDNIEPVAVLGMVVRLRFLVDADEDLIGLQVVHTSILQETQFCIVSPASIRFPQALQLTSW